MATHQLGPETPRPFAVISERHSKVFSLPELKESELYSFGPVYEARLFDMIHRYLELGTDDCLCYVGPDPGSLARRLQAKFCLLAPVTTVSPGHVHYQESSSGDTRVPIKIAHIGADEYFRESASQGLQFDKILVQDSLHTFSSPQETYSNIMRCLSRTGRLLIIHRAGGINTLPLASEARQRVEASEEQYMQVIHDLQGLYYDVQWEVEVLPVVLPKVTWYSMLQQRFPPQLAVISSHEVSEGIRELSEGILKYEGDMVEFKDRLLFISASHSAFTDYPSIQRFGAATVNPFPGMKDLQYQMEMTADLKACAKGNRTKHSGN